MTRIRSSIALALAGATAGVLLLQPTAAMRVPWPSQAEPTSTPGCDPSLVDPTVTLEFRPSTARSGQSVTARARFRNFSAYAVELFLSMPGQRTILQDWSGAYSSSVALTFLAPGAQGNWAAYVRARGEGVTCENGRTVLSYRSFESTAPFTLTVSGSLIWLPLVSRKPAAPTETTSTPTPLPADRYLFVERWEHQVRGPGCGMMLIDSPTYRFFPDPGVLRLDPILGWNPPLETTDLGYYGSGRSVEGENAGGIDCGLRRIVTLPFEADDVRIQSLDGDGAVVVARDGADIALAPGSERRWQWVGSGDAPGCVVTTTLRVTNYGYQDRQKIEVSRLH